MLRFCILRSSRFGQAAKSLSRVLQASFFPQIEVFSRQCEKVNSDSLEFG